MGNPTGRAIQRDTFFYTLYNIIWDVSTFFVTMTCGRSYSRSEIKEKKSAFLFVFRSLIRNFASELNYAIMYIRFLLTTCFCLLSSALRAEEFNVTSPDSTLKATVFHGRQALLYCQQRRQNHSRGVSSRAESLSGRLYGRSRTV